MARVLLTGATGFVGGRIAARLRRRGDEVRSVGRRRTDGLDDLGVEQHVADLADERELRPLFDDVDAVVHAAAASGPDLASARRLNRDGTRALAEAAAHAGVPGFVHVSTTSVYDLAAVGDAEVREDAPLVEEPRDATEESPSVYALTKAEAERELAQMSSTDLHTVVLRPPAVLGAGPTSTWGTQIPTRFRDGTLEPRPPETTFGWVHIEDLVDAVVTAAAEPRPAVCNVVGGNTTFGHYLASLRAFLPEAPATKAVTDASAWRGHYAADALPRVLGCAPHRSFESALDEIAASWR